MSKIQDAIKINKPLQGNLFSGLNLKLDSFQPKIHKINETYFYSPKIRANYIQLQNRRYIGSKSKLIEWIFSIINKECASVNSFADLFAGTGIVSAVAAGHYSKILVNDFLNSNNIIYKAFFGKGLWSEQKTNKIIEDYNAIIAEDLEENYFSKNFGGKYFSKNSSKKIGFIRQKIELEKKFLTEKEYAILVTSLIYAIDKIANTVGHYDAFFKKGKVDNGPVMKPIDVIGVEDVSIFKEDANELAKKIKADIVYIDPPYNSRQYSRFYHVLETLTKWDCPQLYGVALKPEPENMSDYCRVQARDKFADLVKNLDTKYIVVSYNNTYESKSNSSKNKITLQEIENILSTKGLTKVFEKDYRHFNAGNTDLKNHKEYLFVTRIK